MDARRVETRTMPTQIGEKEWVRQMGQKFLKWREQNRHSGPINVPEVARWTQSVVLEMRENDKK